MHPMSMSIIATVLHEPKSQRSRPRRSCRAHIAGRTAHVLVREPYLLVAEGSSRGQEAPRRARASSSQGRPRGGYPSGSRAAAGRSPVPASPLLCHPMMSQPSSHTTSRTTSRKGPAGEELAGWAHGGGSPRQPWPRRGRHSSGSRRARRRQPSRAPSRASRIVRFCAILRLDRLRSYSISLVEM